MAKGRAATSVLLYIMGFNEARTRGEIYSEMFKRGGKKRLILPIIRIFSLHLSSRLRWEGPRRDGNVDAAEGSEMYPVSISRKG